MQKSLQNSRLAMLTVECCLLVLSAHTRTLEPVFFVSLFSAPLEFV